MTWIVSKIAGLGDYFMSLSNRTRLQLVLISLLLLGGSGIYKLVVSIQKLQDPLPMATPAQLIKPMEGLVKQTSSNLSDYRIERHRSLKRLDSLKTIYATKKTTER